jgi:hypothetical protein
MQHFKLSQAQAHTITYGFDMNKAPSLEEKQTAKEAIQQIHNIGNDDKIILFNGTLDYKPNLDAVVAIVEHINPILLKDLSFKYKIIICGKGLPGHYNNLSAYAAHNIIYAGFVDNINQYFLGLVRPIGLPHLVRIICHLILACAQPLQRLCVHGRRVDRAVAIAPIHDLRQTFLLTALDRVVLRPKYLKEGQVDMACVITVSVVLRQHFPIGTVLLFYPSGVQLDLPGGRHPSDPFYQMFGLAQVFIQRAGIWIESGKNKPVATFHVRRTVKRELSQVLVKASCVGHSLKVSVQ